MSHILLPPVPDLDGHIVVDPGAACGLLAFGRGRTLVVWSNRWLKRPEEALALRQAAVAVDPHTLWIEDTYVGRNVAGSLRVGFNSGVLTGLLLADTPRLNIRHMAASVWQSWVWRQWKHTLPPEQRRRMTREARAALAERQAREQLERWDVPAKDAEWILSKADLISAICMAAWVLMEGTE